MHGKRLAFVLPVLIFWTSAAHAESVDMSQTDGLNEIMKSVSGTRPVLLKGMFSLDGILKQSDADEAKSLEDIILERWKEKQLDRWKNLPSRTFEINASAYTASADECGNSKGITASGIKVAANRTLACPPQYPFGAKIAIEGYGTYRCEDRGGAIKGNHFDIYMETKQAAFAFGRRHLTAEVVTD